MISKEARCFTLNARHGLCWYALDPIGNQKQNIAGFGVSFIANLRDKNDKPMISKVKSRLKRKSRVLRTLQQNIA